VHFVAQAPGVFAKQHHRDNPVMPDLVAEIASPGNPMGEIQHRARSWVEAGVKRVWVIGDEHLVLVYRPGAVKPEVLGPGDTLPGDQVLPELSIAVNDFYPTPPSPPPMPRQ